MCRGPFIFRRNERTSAEAIREHGSKQRYRHLPMRIRLDLATARWSPELDFHDEARRRQPALGGNYVAFTYRGRRREETGADTATAARNTMGDALRARVSA